MIRFLFTCSMAFLLLHLGTHFGLVIEHPALTASVVIAFCALYSYITRPIHKRRES